MNTRMTRDDVIRIVKEARKRGAGPDLSGADLRYANLRGANLPGANLDGANLDGAKLRGAKLYGVIGWGGLTIDGLHPYRVLLIPTPDGWRLIIGCWTGTPVELRTLIAGDDWPEAQGDEITRRRPLLEAALNVVDAHITAHLDVINDMKERWEA